MTLERDWKQYAIETSSGIYPLDEKFDECRGPNELGLIFRVAGMDGSSPDHFSILTVDVDGSVRDWGTQGYGMRVGVLRKCGPVTPSPKLPVKQSRENGVLSPEIEREIQDAAVKVILSGGQDPTVLEFGRAQRLAGMTFCPECGSGGECACIGNLKEEIASLRLERDENRERHEKLVGAMRWLSRGGHEWSVPPQALAYMERALLSAEPKA